MKRKKYKAYHLKGARRYTVVAEEIHVNHAFGTPNVRKNMPTSTSEDVPKRLLKLVALTLKHNINLNKTLYYHMNYLLMMYLHEPPKASNKMHKLLRISHL